MRYAKLCMDNGSIAANSVCAQCGTRADVGQIFCKLCGRALRSPVPLFSPTTDDFRTAPPRLSVRAIVIVFTLTALAGFVMGYIDHPSVLPGVFGIVGGLFSTAFWIAALNWMPKKSTDDPREMARWVP